MIQGWMTPWLLVAVPALGSVLSLLLWSSLHRMKNWGAHDYGGESPCRDRGVMVSGRAAG